MTKPCNSPGKKLQRQVKALDRMTKRGPGSSNPEIVATFKAAVAATRANIAANPGRDTRTKKDRSARGKLARAA